MFGRYFKCLKTLQSYFFTAIALQDLASNGTSGDRPDVPNVIILVTDSQSEDDILNAFQIADQLKTGDVRIIAAGVGQMIDSFEIVNIASSPTDVNAHYLNDFGELAGLSDAILQSLYKQCKGKLIPKNGLSK